MPALTHDAKQASDLPTVPLWIDGEATASEPPTLFTVHGPLRNEDLHLVQSANVKAAKRAADSSLTAFQSRKTKSVVERRDLVEHIEVILDRMTEDLVGAQMEETSCTEQRARMNVMLAVSSVKETASRLTSIGGEIPSTSYPGQLSLAFKEPIGPMLTIAP